MKGLCRTRESQKEDSELRVSSRGKVIGKGNEMLIREKRNIDRIKKEGLFRAETRKKNEMEVRKGASHFSGKLKTAKRRKGVGKDP